MKTARKVLMLVLCAALLVSATVMGTLAYLKDTTDPVNNTFTVGQVGIDLDEAPVDLYGEEQDGDRVKANEYKLIPGHTYTKDPTITVDATSENCWLFVKVENSIASLEAEGNTIHDAMIKDGVWTVVDEANGIYGYKDIVAANAEVVVFSSFTLADDADVASVDIETDAIKVTAYAVQADGFAADEWTLAEIWDEAF